MGVNKVESVVTGYAQACLADLTAAGVPPTPRVCLHSEAGWTILLSVFPTPLAGIPGLSACDRACLALLSQVEEPLSAVRVCRQLRDRRIYAASLSTVQRSLIRLRNARIICNSRRKPRGYYLPEAGSTLFRFDWAE